MLNRTKCLNAAAWVSLALVMSSTPARAQTPSKQTPAPAKQGINRGEPYGDYRIGAGDMLRIFVYNEPSASIDNVMVRPDGKITIPYAREIQVDGLTAS